MIRTLVVEDDYRVARIHAASIDRVDGFGCVGAAHTAAEAREMITRIRPDLLLLDVYLPDEDGLSLLRSLGIGTQAVPDCIVVTASRDMQVVTAARRAGALYYLVKPFGYEQLKEQLANYRRWRAQLSSAAEADQATLDTLFHPPTPERSRIRLPLTMQSVLTTVRDAGKPLTAADCALQLGISRATAQRYLSELERQGLLQLNLEYRPSGRPVNQYQAVRRDR